MPEHKFRSKFEERIWANIPKSARVDYEPDDPKIKYNVPHRYVPDFVVKRGKSIIIVEAKGYFPSRDRGKMRRVKRDNPDLDIRFLFMRADQKIGRSASSKTYGEWAEYHGFPWAEGDAIPEEWLKE